MADGACIARTRHTNQQQVRARLRPARLAWWRCARRFGWLAFAFAFALAGLVKVNLFLRSADSVRVARLQPENKLAGSDGQSARITRLAAPSATRAGEPESAERLCAQNSLQSPPVGRKHARATPDTGELGGRQTALRALEPATGGERAN